MGTLTHSPKACILFFACLSILLPTVIAITRVPDGLIWGKEITFDVISLLAIALVVLNKAPASSKVRITLIDLLTTVFFLFRIVSVVLLHPVKGIPFQAINSICLWFVYIALTRAATYPRALLDVRHLLLSGLFLQVIIGGLQSMQLIPSYHTFFPITGAFFNPGPYCINLVALLSFCLPFVFTQIKVKPLLRFVLVSAFLTGTYLLIIGQSRTAWISFIVVCSLLSFINSKKILKKWVKVSLPIILVVMVLGGRALYNFKKESAEGRIMIWSIGLNVIRENFWFGVGEGNFPYKFLQKQRVFFQESDPNLQQKYKERASEISFAFNDFIQITAEGGIFLLIIFSSTMIISTVFLYKQIKEKPHLQDIRELKGLLLLLVSILCCSMFAYPLSIMPFKSLILIPLAFASKGMNAYLIFPRRNKLQSIVRLSICGIIIIVSFKLIMVIYAISKWTSSLMKRDSIQLNTFRSNYPYLKDNGYFLSCFADILSKKSQGQASINIYKEAELLLPQKFVSIALAEQYIKCNQIDSALCKYVYLSQCFPNDRRLLEAALRLKKELVLIK